MSACGFRLPVALACTWILLLSGCQTEQPPPEPVPEPEPPPVIAPAAPDVEPILEQARPRSRRTGLLLQSKTAPLPCTRRCCALIRATMPHDRGLEKIVERYVRFALEAIERRQFPRARSMLARARLVDETHPAIEPTEQQILLVENAERDRIRLDPGALGDRTVALAALLRNLGTRAKASGCRVSINARSDAEGRWIYQQLNSAAGAARIRARLVVASPPSVELICIGQPG